MLTDTFRTIHTPIDLKPMWMSYAVRGRSWFLSNRLSRLTSHTRPAVEGDGLAGQIGGFIGGQISGQGSNLIRLFDLRPLLPDRQVLVVFPFSRNLLRSTFTPLSQGIFYTIVWRARGTLPPPRLAVRGPSICPCLPHCARVPPPPANWLSSTCGPKYMAWNLTGILILNVRKSYQNVGFDHTVVVAKLVSVLVDRLCIKPTQPNNGRRNE